MNRTRKKPFLLISAIILYACCLRAPFTGTGSILTMIRTDLQLSGSSAGMLTSIPLFTFALLSIASGYLAQKLGAGNAMIIGAALISLGIFARAFSGSSGLFLGTVILGAGITIGNVLLPAIVKACFPEHTSAMTSCYTTIMSVASGISGGISVPLALRFGWSFALGIWLILSLLTLLLWLPCRHIRLQEEYPPGDIPQSNSAPPDIKTVTCSPTAWAVGIYMGLQSLVFYSFVSWFATILQSRGFSAAASGNFNSLYLFVGLAGSFAAPFLADLRKDKSWLGLLLGTLYAAGILILILVPGSAGVWGTIIVSGFCQGACFSYSMLMFVFHTRTAAVSSILSAFGQSVGYLIASAGPALTGKLFDLSGNWDLILWILFGVSIALLFLGRYIGKEKEIG